MRRGPFQDSVGDQAGREPCHPKPREKLLALRSPIPTFQSDPSAEPGTCIASCWSFVSLYDASGQKSSSRRTESLSWLGLRWPTVTELHDQQARHLRPHTDESAMEAQDTAWPENLSVTNVSGNDKDMKERPGQQERCTADGYSDVVRYEVARSLTQHKTCGIQNLRRAKQQR